MHNLLTTIDYRSTNFNQNFVKSLKDIGFAIISNHPLDINLINSVYQEWELFFNSKNKLNYLFDLEKQDGFFPYQSENAKGYTHKDLKEFYHFYEWGRLPENMSNKTLSMFNSLIKLGEELLQLIDFHSPKDIQNYYSMPLSDMIANSSMNLLRIIHYPPIMDKTPDEAIRAGAHEDINLITLLSPGSQPGLQVKNVDGNWLDVKCEPNWLVVNTGDMLTECSKGYFPSTTHRVVNPKMGSNNLSRYTIPLFIHPRDEVILSPKYTAKSFLEERLKEIGLK